MTQMGHQIITALLYMGGARFPAFLKGIMLRGAGFPNFPKGNCGAGFPNFPKGNFPRAQGRPESPVHGAPLPNLGSLEERPSRHRLIAAAKVSAKILASSSTLSS